jgi:hypothetical protein
MNLNRFVEIINIVGIKMLIVYGCKTILGNIQYVTVNTGDKIKSNFCMDGV